MSKMSQAVYAGQEFAQQNYNLSKDEFVTLSKDLGPVVKDSALEEYNLINSEMHEYFGHPEFG